MRVVTGTVKGYRSCEGKTYVLPADGWTIRYLTAIGEPNYQDELLAIALVLEESGIMYDFHIDTQSGRQRWIYLTDEVDNRLFRSAALANLFRAHGFETVAT